MSSATLHTPGPGPQRWLPLSGAILIRLATDNDVAAMLRFQRSLSDESVFLRYFVAIARSRRNSEQLLPGMCVSRPEGDVLMIAEDSATRDTVGVGTLYNALPHEEAEVALIVRDDWQRRGIGTALFDALLTEARRRGVRKLVALMLPTNLLMRRLCEMFGMQVEDALVGASDVRAILDLTPDEQPNAITALDQV